MRVEVKRLSLTAVIPVRGSSQAAGYDLCADIPKAVVLHPGETVKIGTGLAFALPDGYFGGIFARSGISIKKGLRLGNCTGVVDSDYRGEVIVALYNDSDREQTVEPGERIAQMVLLPYLAVEFSETDELDETLRGTGGFGSTGA